MGGKRRESRTTKPRSQNRRGGRANAQPVRKPRRANRSHPYPGYSFKPLRTCALGPYRPKRALIELRGYFFIGWTVVWRPTDKASNPNSLDDLYHPLQGFSIPFIRRITNRGPDHSFDRKEEPGPLE